MTGIRLGQYVHGSSFLHTLDPRTKIICCLLVFISVFINSSWVYLMALLLCMTAAILASGMNLRYIFSSLKSIRALLLVTFLLQAFLTPGDFVFQWGILHISREGLNLGTVNLFRLLILYLGSLAVLLTTTPMKISAGIEWLLLPLYRFNIPVQHLSTILSISFRFIPTLIDEASRIKNAQWSRGAQFDSPRLVARLKSYLSILIPLFEASLSRAEDLGEAMDSRCFTAHPNQLRMSRLHMQGRDFTSLAFMLAVLSAGIWLSSIG